MTSGVRRTYFDKVSFLILTKLTKRCRVSEKHRNDGRFFAPENLPTFRFPFGTRQRFLSEKNTKTPTFFCQTRFLAQKLVDFHL